MDAGSCYAKCQAGYRPMNPAGQELVPLIPEPIFLVSSSAVRKGHTPRVTPFNIHPVELKMRRSF
jgi:hypothetical protein